MRGRVVQRALHFVRGHPCVWLMAVAIAYVFLRFYFVAPKGAVHFISFFGAFQVVTLCFSLGLERYVLPNQEHYRPNSDAGVWCCLLLPLVVASSISWVDPGRPLAVLSFLCMITIKQLFSVVTTLKGNLLLDLLFTLPCLFKDLESASATLMLFTEVLLLFVVCDLLMEYLPRYCSKTFTFGESCIVVQCLLLPVCAISNYLPVHVWESDGLINFSSPVAVFIEPNIVQLNPLDKILFLMTLYCFLILAGLCVLRKIFGGYIIQYLYVLTLVLAWCLAPVTQQMTWSLINYCTNSKLKCMMLLYWVLCALLAVNVVHHYSSDKGSESSTVVRKIFHLIALAVFIPGLLGFKDILYIASVLAFLVFLSLECIRLLDIPPLATLLSSSLGVFRDNQDSGALLLTHIYLLVGFSCPIWIGFNILEAGTPLKLFSGVISLGIGDTAASVGGTLFGRTHWPKSRKTVEGTVCAMVSQLVAVVAIVQMGADYTDAVSVSMAIVLTSLLEAFTTQIDNLVLPFYMYVFLSVPWF